MLLGGCNGANKEASAPIEVVTAPKGVAAYGKVMADTIREVYIDFPAITEEIKVKEGEYVKKGAPLIVLDDTAYKNQIIKKEQEIKRLQVQQANIQKQVEPSGIELLQIKNELSLKQAKMQAGTDPDVVALQEQIKLMTEEIQEAQKLYEANKQLNSLESLSDTELKVSELKLKELEKAKKEAEVRLNSLKSDKELEISNLNTALQAKQTVANNSNSSLLADAEVLGLQIQNAQLELEDMKAKLDKVYLKGDTIIADKDSIVEKVGVKLGSVLGQEGSGITLSLVDQASLVVTVDVPENFIQQVTIGDKAEVTLNAYDGVILKAQVTHIAEQATMVNGENMVKVDLEVQEGKEKLKLGYEVDATIY